jgi:hypothetical protein
VLICLVWPFNPILTSNRFKDKRPDYSYSIHPKEYANGVDVTNTIKEHNYSQDYSGEEKEGDSKDYRYYI